MNRDQVVNGIIRTWSVAEELQLAETFSNAGPLPMNEEFRDLALSDDASYRELYMCGLSLSHYNILLADYSFLQFSIDRPDYVRYAFYPNPFVAGREQDVEAFKRRRELVEAGMISHEEFLAIVDGHSRSSGVPMLRYENAPEQRVQFHHPCSHFHIGFHSDNRWPLNRILTPLAFSLLVFKAYYGAPWSVFGAGDEREEVKNIYERMLIDEKAECRLVEHDLFEGIEQRSFHFS
ncbi:DUF2290 domain-containing protein [Burkholderia pyrrocinia]|uniref:DUF2290 domain-containing protein n=1 Tax=Burkholderia pyrrocinia TaxID=60550 RepID=UPI002AB17726|nr:DUF2290 domain-containing protein [Burkholderia pyrrocinia]